ncbi:MAG: glycosyltransferase [Proteobacteria bacterium]|nr:glycosyltransferase [Pseudomonadota bacterium]
MKVALLAGKFPLLSETFVLNQAAGLLACDVEVDIYAGRPPADTIIHEGDISAHLYQAINYWPNRLEEIPSIVLRLIKLLLSKRGRIIFSRMTTTRIGNAPITKLERLVMGTFCHYLRSYDAILAHFGPLGMIAEELRRIGALNGPLITVFHGYDLSGLLQEKGKDLYDQFLQKLDLALPVSEFWRQRLIELGADESRTIVHHTGIDCERFVFQARYPGTNGLIQMIAVARLVEKKGLEYAIRAFAKVFTKHPGARLCIVGDGPLRSKLEGIRSEAGLQDSVQFLGWRTSSEVVELLANAHMLIAPSVTSADGDMEGIPVSIMEAMAQGLPVVATQHSGIPELVKDGESGLLVPERDVDSLAGAIDQMLSFPDRWESMGKSGRKYIEAHFNQSILNDRLVEIIRNLHMKK